MGTPQTRAEAVPADIAITLVHGTWGRGIFPGLRLPWRGPFWFERGSRFRTELEQLLAGAKIPATIDAFLWSGANSVFQRSQAAAGLARAINEGSAEHPDRMRFVVAHSHGGSVAMLALRHVEEAARNRLSLVTLATPFMEIVPEGIADRNIKLIIGLLLLFSLGFSVLAFLPLVYGGLVALQIPPDSVPDFVNVFLFVAGLIIPAMVVFYVVGPTRGRREERLIEATGDGVATDYASNMLALRGIDDEATLVLAAGAIGNRLSLYLVRIVWLSLVLTFLALMYVHLSGTGPAYVRENIVQISSFVLWLSLPGIAIFLLILSGLFKGVYGRELFIRSILCQVNSHSSPDQSGRLWVITLGPSRAEQRGLRHALYDHERAASAIVNWIERQLRPDAPAPAAPAPAANVRGADDPAGTRRE